MAMAGYAFWGLVDGWDGPLAWDPAQVPCPACGASEARSCINRTTGLSAKRFHQERLKLERRVRACVILSRDGPLTAMGAADALWPLKDARACARNAATFLRSLAREGRVLVDHKSWGTMYRVHRPLYTPPTYLPISHLPPLTWS